MRATVWLVAFALVGFPGTVSSRSEEPVPAASAKAEDPVERERIRAAVESILGDMGRQDPATGDFVLHPFDGVDRLVALGPGVEPFLEAELTAPRSPNFEPVCIVLGLLRSAESVEALRRAVAAADENTTATKHKQKLWSSVGLAIAGDPEAVRRIGSGKVDASRMVATEGLFGLATVSVLTWPGSVPILLERLDREAATEGSEPTLALTLDALGRVGDPSTATRIVAIMDQPDGRVRSAAARALAEIASPATADRLFAALEDPDESVREEAAVAIENLKPAGATSRLRARLEAEPATMVRIPIYRTLAAMEKEEAIGTLASAWGRPDYLDRLWIADAAGRTGSKKGLNLLRTALRDPDVAIALRALGALAEIGGAGARDTLLAAVADSRETIAMAAVDELVRLGERRAGPRVADRLAKILAVGPSLEPSRKPDVKALGEALLALRHTELVPTIREAAKSQPDAELAAYLGDLAARLSVVAETGEDRAKWIEAAGSENAGMRRLAYSRLGDLGGPDAVRALSAAFGRVEAGEGVAILEALGRIGSAEAAPLIERVLLDDAFDAFRRRPLRDMAAWAAWKVGGERMETALRKAVERREGREILVAVYYAEAAGKRAVPVLRSVRIPRMRHLERNRGAEDDRLRWMIRELDAGRSIASLGRPPVEIALE